MADVTLEFVLYRSCFSVYEMYEIFLSRIPVFIVGLICGEHILQKGEINKKQFSYMWILLIGAGMGIVLFERLSLPPFVYRYFAGALGVSATVVYAWVRYSFSEWTDRVKGIFSWFGTFSLETYLVHITLVNVIKYYDGWNYVSTIGWYIIFFAVTLPGTCIVSKVSGTIIKHIEGRT